MSIIKNFTLSLMMSIIFLTFMSIAVSADTSFKDVKEGSWYYEAVSETVEAGVFTGTSKDTFSPNQPMTRAMFVTTLARMNNVDVSGYTDVSFSDVKAGEWYAPYVEWAYKNEITGGIGGGKFGVNNTITRQEMVTLFYKSAALFGEYTEIPDQFKYDRSADRDSVADWAQEGMKWALSNFVISGTGNEGTELILSPAKTATRAEAAQLIVNYFNFQKADEPYIGKLTINGADIENYKIVHADNSESKDAAEALAEYIERSTGKKLSYVTDSEPLGEYEILIGQTNREGNVVSVDRDGEDICSFEISVQGNYLVIAGKDDEYEGGSFGVIGFALENLGFGFYTNEIYTIKRQEAVDIPNGYLFKDGPKYEHRQIIRSSMPEEDRTGSPFKTQGMVHNLPDITGVKTGEPCLTDPDIIQYSIDRVKYYLNKRPDLDIIWVSQNDSPDCCACDRCMEVYRKEGTRGATLMLLCDKIAKAIEEDYPDCNILTLAYLHTTLPVKSKLDDSVIVYYCPIENCASHDYNDPNCPLNSSLLANINGWNKVCSKLWVWDYSCNYSYSFAPLPMLESLRDNKEWFYKLGVRGEFNNGISGKLGEFASLVGYLTGKLQWDPCMPEEEYQAETDAFLEAYYGAGWKNIRSYIDTVEMLSEKNHFGYHASPETIIEYDDILKYMDTFDGYWDSAEAMAKDTDELERIRASRVSWTYIKLTALYTRDYFGDDPEAKQEYINKAESFFDELGSLEIKWAETNRGNNPDPAIHPREWLPA